MAPLATNVVVGGTGGVWVAPAATALPTTFAALPGTWKELGYVSEDGVTFGLSRDVEDVRGWQSSDPLRRLITAEPKTIGFELMEFGNPDSIRLAFRGGVVAVLTGVATYTPPAAGATDVRAMILQAVDGIYKFWFCFAAVELSGDVETQLQKGDAARLPLEFGVNAGGWKIMSDHPAWIAGAGGEMPTGATVAEVKGALPALSDAELDSVAGFDDRKGVQEAIEAERKRRAELAAAA